MALREPLFSVIIPSYNGARLLERCLSSLSHVRYPADRREWIVVDNGSSDGTQTMVRRRFPGTKIIRLPQNLGFTGGIAAGVSAAQGRYLVFLNNDMRVTPQWLEAFDEVLRGQHAVCATGKILDRTGKYVDFIQGILLFDGHALQRFQGARAENFQGLQPHPTFIACGGNMAVCKDVFLSLGGFDRDFFAYTEDVDFSWRLHAAGFQIIFAPEAVTFHDHQATSNRLGRYRRGFLYERNAFACLYKNIDDPFFHTLAHLAWVTLIHRTRWIVSLHEPESLIALRSPFGEWDGPGQSSDKLPPPAAAGIFETIRRDWRVVLRKGMVSFQKGNYKDIREWVSGIVSDCLRTTGVKRRSSASGIVWSHPYVQSQLQALWDISRSMERLQNKRIEVQSRRRVSDRDIFERFPPWIVTTYPGDDQLFASPWFRSLLPPDISFRFASLREVHGDAAVERDHSNV